MKRTLSEHENIIEDLVRSRLARKATNEIKREINEHTSDIKKDIDEVSTSVKKETSEIKDGITDGINNQFDDYED